MGLFDIFKSNIKKLEANKDVQGLIEASSKSQDNSKRREKTEAIVRIGESAIEPLIQALNHEHGAVREEAVWALGTLGNKKAIDPIVHTLIDKKYYVRDMAIKSLEMLNWKPRNEIETIYHLIAKKKWDELEKFNGTAVEPLLKILEFEEYDPSIAEVLGKIKDKRAVSPLIKLLVDNIYQKHGREVLVKAASKSLGEIGDINAYVQLCYIKDFEEIGPLGYKKNPFNNYNFEPRQESMCGIAIILNDAIKKIEINNSKKDITEAIKMKDVIKKFVRGGNEFKNIRFEDEYFILSNYQFFKENLDRIMDEESKDLNSAMVTLLGMIILNKVEGAK